MNKAKISQFIKRAKKKALRTGGFFFDLFDLILDVIGMLKNAK